MKYILKSISELFLRLKLYVFGVRFYEGEADLTSRKETQHEIDIGGGQSIKLSIIKIVCRDYLLKRSGISHDEYHSYIVSAELPDNVPDAVRMLSKRSFFFSGKHNGIFLDEDKAIMLVIDIYIDFIKSLLINIEPAHA